MISVVCAVCDTNVRAARLNLIREPIIGSIRYDISLYVVSLVERNPECIYLCAENVCTPATTITTNLPMLLLLLLP